jgi:hypothetical protein
MNVSHGSTSWRAHCTGLPQLLVLPPQKSQYPVIGVSPAL